VNHETDLESKTLKLIEASANQRLKNSGLSVSAQSLDAATAMVSNYLAGRPTEIGRGFFRAELARLLANRTFHLQRSPMTVAPQVRSEPVVLIIGLPRTGSTFLHHLLTKGLGWKAPSGAQLYNLEPNLPSDHYRRDARRRSDRAERRSPGLSVAHPFPIRSAEECTPGVANHLAGIIPRAQWNDSSAPVRGERYASALSAYVADLFALGVFGSSRTPIVLKSPGHTLDVVGATRILRPDLVIWLTRDHAAVLRSWNILVSRAKHLFGLAHTKSSEHMWRAVWLDADSADNRKNLDMPHLFVSFDRVVNSPATVCEEVAQAGGWPFCPGRLGRASQLLSLYQRTRH
jgi:hypothetical protein